MSTGAAGHGASASPPPPDAVAAVDGVLAAVDFLAESELWRLGDDQLADVVLALEKAERRLAAVRLRSLRRLDVRGGAAVLSEGAAMSTAGWLRVATRCRPGRANGEVGLAESLARFWPGLNAALLAGDISLEQASACVKALESLPDDVEVAVLERAEAFLLEQCAVLDPNQLARIGKHLLHVLDPDGPALLEQTEQRDRDRRELRVSESRGGVRLQGWLDAEAGATLLTALDPLAAPRTGADQPGGRDPRDAAQRRGDALVELAGRALDAGDLPTEKKERPHLTVTLDHATLVGAVGAMGAELDRGGPLSAEAARRLACDSEVIPVVLGGSSEPLDVGREQRTVPRHMRRALVARDRICAFPGCDRPPAWCEAHHVVHWADGGETKIDNLALLCRRHHTVIHHGGWKVFIDPATQHPVFVDPRGQEHPSSGRARSALEQLALPPPDPPTGGRDEPSPEPRGP